MSYSSDQIVWYLLVWGFRGTFVKVELLRMNHQAFFFCFKNIHSV